MNIIFMDKNILFMKLIYKIVNFIKYIILL